MSKYVFFSNTCRGQCLAWARAFSAGAAAKEATQPHWPVIISGAGPVGLTMALWLSRFGVRSLVLERALEPTRHPQAHYVNNRTMEVLRPLWDLSHEMVAASPPLDHWRTFRYAFTMTGHGETLGVVDHFAGAKSAYNHAVSPEPVTHLPQHQLLPMLLARASAPHSLVTLLWGHSVTGFTPEPGRVAVVVEDSQRAQRTFHGSFLVAADGAHSTIRQQLGIPQSGQAGIQHLINIHFTSPSLGARLLQGTTRANQPCGKTKAAMLYFVFNREVVGVVVAHSLVRGEFVMQVPYLPPLQSAADFPEAKCRQLVGSASGLAPSQLMDLIIHQIRPWQMNAVVADSFQHAPPGSGGVPRVFLVGDAAHCFPPAGGLGMNTGIQDAHNLAWKLALVTKQHSNGNAGRGGSTTSTSSSSSGSSSSSSTSATSSDMAASSTSSNSSSNMNSRAYVDGLTTSSVAASSGGPQLALGQAASLLPDPAHLLSTYEHERKPVAHANCALSLRNWQEAVTIPSTLGLDPRAADALNSAVNAVPLVPSAAGKALLEAGLAVGRTVTTSPWSPLRPVQLARIKAKCEAGITLRLQYPKEDLGFQYPPTSPDRPTAVAPSSPLTPATNTSPQGINKPAAVLRDAPYVPSTEPGCRLPHLWLRNPTATTPSPPTSPPAPGVSHLHDSPQAPWSSEVWLHRHGYKPSSLLSTIDVVAGMPRAHSTGSHQGGHTFVGPVQPHLTLFVDEAQGPHNPWLLGLATLSEQCGGPQHLPVSAVQIIPSTAAAAAGSSTDHDDARQLAPSQADGQPQQPAVQAFVDVHGKWHSTMQLPHGSALLVRPDGHVAWRHGSLPHSSRASSTSDAAPAVQGNSTTIAAAAAAAKLLRDAVSMVLQGTS